MEIIGRLIMDLLMIGVSFCWGCKIGMEYMEKKAKENEKNEEGNT